MCQFGLRDPIPGDFYRKSIRVIGRLLDIQQLAKRCDGEQHSHQHVENSVVVHGKSVKRF